MDIKRTVLAAASTAIIVAGNISMPVLADYEGNLPVGGLVLPDPPIIIDLTSEETAAYIQDMDNQAIATADMFHEMLCAIEELPKYEVQAEEEHEKTEPYVPVYTNVNCVIDEEIAPDAMNSLSDGLAIFNVKTAGKSFSISSEVEKKFVYPLTDCDGVIKVSQGGNVEYITNQDTTKKQLIFNISGDAVYTPVVAE